MRNPLLTFAELIYPFVLGFILIIVVVFYKSALDNKIKFSFFGVSFELPFSNTFVIRILLLLGSIMMFSLPSFKDFSRFFPSHYDMEVFFDNEGMEKSLEIYDQREIAALHIDNNWRVEKFKYLKNLSKDVSRFMGIENFFESGGQYTYSRGHTNFVVEKTEGWQNYHIKEAAGQLIHVSELPNRQKKQFHSRFELLETGNNYIDVSLSDIYLSYTKIIKPYFKQVGSLTPAGDKFIYHHSLIAVIKIRFFPIIKIGNTIYLVRSSDGIQWVPIGYAVYKPSK